MTNICEKLKMMREKAGYQQGQIADYLNVTQEFVSKVETGEQNLTVDQLESLGNLYGCSLASFADMENDEAVDGGMKHDVHPVQFAFKVQEATQEDLRMIANINKIANNSRFMSKTLKI